MLADGKRVVSAYLKRAACHSAWGPDSDRRHKPLIRLTGRGSHLHAYSQAIGGIHIFGDGIPQLRTLPPFLSTAEDCGQLYSTALLIIPRLALSCHRLRF